MLEKWKSALDKGENVCVYGSQKAFDRKNHELLLVKLKAYGFSIKALDSMCGYLKKPISAISANKY